MAIHKVTPAMRAATLATIQKVLRLREAAGHILTPKERKMLGRAD